MGKSFSDNNRDRHLRKKRRNISAS